MTFLTIDLETHVTRDLPITQTESSTQVAQDELDEPVITLSVGGPWGTTYAGLTAEGAQAIATALEETATQRKSYYMLVRYTIIGSTDRINGHLRG